MIRHFIKKNYILFPLLCTFLLTGSMLSGCHSAAPAKTKTSFAFDTVITLTWYDDNDDDVMEQTLANCSHYEKIFSRTDPDSELSLLNASDKKNIPVSDELFNALKTALYYCELSHGRFDITMGAVSDLYGFSKDTHHVPTENELNALLPHTGYKKIRLNEAEHSVTVDDPDLRIDLGAIAKGIIADDMKAQLKAAGVSSAIINLGGNILLIGSRPDGGDYEVGIQYPEQGRSDTITHVTLSDKAVVTSGTYERCFTENGKTYHHLLDPSTGLPIENGLRSVSIIAPDATEADALSTCVFALGMDEGKNLLEQLELEGIFITEAFQVERFPND